MLNCGAPLKKKGIRIQNFFLDAAVSACKCSDTVKHPITALHTVMVIERNKDVASPANAESGAVSPYIMLF
jgi:hypothetical protein